MRGDFLGLEQNRDKWARAATFYAVFLAATLMSVKFMAFQGTGSVAILGSALLSGIGLRGSLAVFLATRRTPPVAAREIVPAMSHPWRLCLEAGIMALCGLYVAIFAIMRLISPPSGAGLLMNIGAGLAVMGVSLMLTLTVIIAYLVALKRTSSPDLESAASLKLVADIKNDKLRYWQSLAMDFVVLIALTLAAGGGYSRADAFAGFSLAAMAGKAAWRRYYDDKR